MDSLIHVIDMGLLFGAFWGVRVGPIGWLCYLDNFIGDFLILELDNFIAT